MIFEATTTSPPESGWTPRIRARNFVVTSLRGGFTLPGGNPSRSSAQALGFTIEEIDDGPGPISDEMNA